MKRILLLVFFTSILFSSKAYHVAGGELRWECLSNGRYVFFLKVYADCSTASAFSFTNETITILGNPLPRGSNNGTISSIVLRPDSNKWYTYNFGDNAPECSSSSSRLNCKDLDEGPIQVFFYQSSPIILQGVPPTNGWHFRTSLPCCRIGTANLLNTNNLILRAIMFPNNQQSNISTCFDSAPEFLDVPSPFFCRGEEYLINYSAIDINNDSLVYSLDSTLDASPNAPYNYGSHTYLAGYSPVRPMPDTTLDSRNKKLTLNQTSGDLRFAVFNGRGTQKNYQVVVRVDSYREGVMIASVTRDIPFVITDCLPLFNQQINSKPQMIIRGDTNDNKEIEVVAGSKLEIPIQVYDYDTSLALSGGQQISVVPSGFMLSRDLIDEDFCRYTPPPGETASCAYFANQDPVFNSTANPPRLELSGVSTVSSNFIWQTKCHHVDIADSLNPGNNKSTYRFVFKSFDDHCPIPGLTYPSLTVVVNDPVPLGQPIVKGVSVGLDGRLTYSWVPPLDSSSSFIEYEVEMSRVVNGNTPVNYLPIRNQGLQKYQQEQRNESYRIFNTSPNNLNDWNILSPIQGQDYYLRMKTASGCIDGFTSTASEAAQIMELEASPSGNIGIEPLRSKITLEWNKAKANNAFSHPYFVYVSRTKYYVWTNELIDSVANGVDVDSNWTLLTSTYSNRLEMPSTRCNNYVAYRIEARDTVVTYKQGNSLNLDSTITLSYSSFSTVDTLYTVLGKALAYKDNLDYIYTDAIYDSEQWINCDSNITLSNANGAQYIPEMAGNYAVVISLDNCMDTSSCITITALDTSVAAISELELRSNEANARYQWIDCRADTIIPGGISRNFLPQDTGYYSVVISKYAMKDTSSCFAMLSISVPEIPFQEKLNLYPNPNNGWFHIESSVKEELELKVFSIQGKLVQEESLINSDTQIQIKGEDGLYFITITNQKGEQANFKVVKR